MPFFFFSYQVPPLKVLTKTSTASSVWRQKGNTCYKAAMSVTTPCFKTAHLKKAIDGYQNALTLADDCDEMSSAAKNLAMANWKMLGAMPTIERLTFYHFAESCKYFSISNARGKYVKSQDWIDTLNASYQSCVEEVLEIVAAISDIKKRISVLEMLLRKMQDDECKAAVYLRLAKALFFFAISLQQDGSFVKSLSLFKDCYMPLEEAKRMAGKNITLPLKKKKIV